ncbi:EAL domain-containing protein [Alishewanella sp. 16-MA]|uniref:EAL domain-containing protein n=1 Tax=Alishewanella maricola TaxID=2795740 RepID=A0ABS8C4Y9_9ALTE|nr:EAL domain-containing protein [Alishewanella maricola]
MPETWKVNDSISRASAVVFYLLTAGFYTIIALLGLVEHLFLAKLILPLLSFNLVLATALVSLGLTALLFNRRKLQIFCGLLILSFISYLWLATRRGQLQDLSGMPLSLLSVLLLLAAAILVCSHTTRVGHYLWRIMAFICLVYGCYAQLSLWFPQLPWQNTTPFSSSLLPIMLIMVGISLWLKQHFQLQVTRPLSHSAIAAMLMFQAGYGIWFALSVFDVRYETHLAEQKVTRVVSQVQAQLAFSEELFQRARTRWQRVNPAERLQFITEDLSAITAAYDVVYGAVIFDQQQQAVLMTGKAASFQEQGLFSSEGTRSWLFSGSDQEAMAINRASLDSDLPIMMLRLALPVTDASPEFLLVLINLQQALLVDNSVGAAKIQIYLEVLPQLLFTADASGFKRATLPDLQRRYPYHQQIQPDQANWGSIPFYVFITDLTELQARSRLHQIILWVSLLFCCTFILAADRTRLLRHEKVKLSTLAKFDDITGLLRRDAFYQAVEQVVIREKTAPEVIIFIDLDGFKPINDSFGHDVGDKLLSEMALRIRLLCGEQALLARFSGDEFLVYLPESPFEATEQLANALLRALSQPSAVTGFDVYLSASIGIVQNQEAHCSSQLLTQLADVAMSNAKQAGGNTYRFYQDTMADNYRNIVAMRNKLQAALDAEQLQVYYQPVMEFSTGKTVAIESLVRWQHQGSFISPVSFIPIAEQTGQIIQIGEQVMKMVLRDLVENPGLAKLSVAINVSAQQLRRYDFVQFLGAVLAEYQIDPARICIELTESALLEEQGHTLALPNQIKALGCQLAIDDFGTGYSSLSYLYRLPADIVKLDRSFTRDLTHDLKQRKIVEMLVSTCNQIGKTVVIEGVETAEMSELCQQLGCDRAQGYYYARPMPLAELLTFLNRPAEQG